MNARLSLPKIPLILSIALINCVNICIAEEAIKTYHAVYQVEIRGKIIGTSELSVQSRPGKNTYRFTSKTVARGMLRLLQPNPILEHTDFIYEKNRIRPTEFWSQNTNGEEKNDLHVVLPSKEVPWTGKKNLTSRFTLTFLLRNRCRSSLDMFQVRVARRSGAIFVFKRCQRPAGGRGDYHRHRFQNANFAQITVRSRSCGY